MAAVCRVPPGLSLVGSAETHTKHCNISTWENDVGSSGCGKEHTIFDVLSTDVLLLLVVVIVLVIALCWLSVRSLVLLELE